MSVSSTLTRISKSLTRLTEVTTELETVWMRSAAMAFIKPVRLDAKTEEKTSLKLLGREIVNCW